MKPVPVILPQLPRDPDRRHARQHARERVGFLLLVGLVVLFAAAKAVLWDTLDPDCFWHLRVAEQLRSEGIGPLRDRLSFASQREPWAPYSWLAELAMKGIWDAGGWRLAVAAQSALTAAFVALLAACCATGASATGAGAAGAGAAAPRSRVAVVVATAFAAYLSLPCLSFRPVTMALVLLALCAWLLLRDRRRGETTRAAWGVVPITALMTNLHLYAAAVPLWLAALLAGAIWERRRRQAGTGGARPVRRYAALLALSLAACCCTPMLPGVIATAIHYQTRDVMMAAGVAAENHPFLSGGLAAIAPLAALLGLALWRRDRLRAGEWLWLLAGVAMLLQIARYSVLYALIAAPVLAGVLPAFSDRLLGRPAVIGLAALVLLAGVARVAVSFPSSHVAMGDWLNRHADSGGGAYPSRAADYVAEHVAPSTGRLVNEFTWGGYLAWRLGDRYQVLLDGRTQVYSADFWRATYLGTAEQCRAYLATVRADAAILPAGQSRFAAPLLSLGWRRAYQDAEAQVLLPPE